MAITTALSKLRLTIGDTDSTNYVFNDDELNWFLSEESDNVPNSALRASYAAAAKYARAYDFETDGQKFWRSQQHAAWLALAKQLESQGATVTGSSSVTSVSTTKVDGYSDSISNDEVSVGTTRRYWPWLDDMPS